MKHLPGCSPELGCLKECTVVVEAINRAVDVRRAELREKFAGWTAADYAAAAGKVAVASPAPAGTTSAIAAGSDEPDRG